MTGKYATFTDTVTLAATVAASRYVTRAGGLPLAGGAAYGVTRTAGIAGDLVACDVNGSSICQAAAAFPIDSALKVDATGQVLLWDVAPAVKVGRALQAAVNIGDLVEVHLIPNV